MIAPTTYDTRILFGFEQVAMIGATRDSVAVVGRLLPPLHRGDIILGGNGEPHLVRSVKHTNANGLFSATLTPTVLQ